MTDLLEKGGVRWMTAYEHSWMTGSLRRAERQYVTCCHCKTSVEYIDSWAAVAFGVHGNRLPLPSFIHCQLCAVTLDAQAAWMSAYQADTKASEPDPEAVKREEDLNRRLNPFKNPDLLP